jgi:hypothetical protein
VYGRRHGRSGIIRSLLTTNFTSNKKARLIPGFFMRQTKAFGCSLTRFPEMKLSTERLNERHLLMQKQVMLSIWQWRDFQMRKQCLHVLRAFLDERFSKFTVNQCTGGF